MPGGVTSLEQLSLTEKKTDFLKSKNTSASLRSISSHSPLSSIFLPPISQGSLFTFLFLFLVEIEVIYFLIYGFKAF